MSRQEHFYHGSNEAFAPGDLIHPPAVSGAANWATRMGYSGDIGPHYSAEHVYHTSDEHAAMDFGSHVYRVEPLTPVEKDPEGVVDPSIGRSQPWTRNRGAARVVEHVIANNRRVQ